MTGHLHTGHRARLTGKIKKGGVIYEHELLEILLFNACPRKDVNHVAHSLIERFSGLAGVLSAPVDEIVKVEGVGENMAEYLLCMGTALSRCGNTNSFAVLKNTAEFKKFIVARPSPDCDETELCMVDKDGRVRRICTYPVHDGEGVSDAELMKILSVYHPFGLFVCNKRTRTGCAPTEFDDGLSTRVKKICLMCNVEVYDFCVVSADGEIYSYYMADRLFFGVHTGE